MFKSSKFTITPLFFALCITLAVFAKWQALLYSLVALSVHEAGHICMAKCMGYPVKSMVLSAFGGKIDLDDMAENDEFFIAFSGPFANMLMGALCLVLRAVLPYFNDFLYTFAVFNFILCAFNLLPFYPLDGARIILSLSTRRIGVLKILKRAGVVAGIIFIVLFIVSIFFKFNLTVGLVGVFLLIGATGAEKKEIYTRLRRIHTNIEDRANKKTKRVKVKTSAPLIKLFKHCSIRRKVDFDVYDGKTKLYELSDAELLELMKKFSPFKSLDECYDRAEYALKRNKIHTSHTSVEKINGSNKAVLN